MSAVAEGGPGVPLSVPSLPVPDTPPTNESVPRALAVEAGSASAPAVKPAYPPPADIPTQEGPSGLRFDFNGGCRVMFPETEHPWRVELRDLDTGNILFQTELKGGRVNSSKRYFVRFRLEVWQQNEKLISHDYSAAGREVLIEFPVGTLGDTMGWFPYAVKFKERHRCKLTCGMAERMIPLFRDAYPDITFLAHEEIKPERYYATYCMGHRRQGLPASALRFPFRRAASHRRLHPRRRPDRGAAAHPFA